ncbi:MAG: hypothetical protein QHI48_00310 [Bacteroidota bacterium]|nr:hypothetical protein [Bacteroidota bacterium]
MNMQATDFHMNLGIKRGKREFLSAREYFPFFKGSDSGAVYESEINLHYFFKKSILILYDEMMGSHHSEQ